MMESEAHYVAGEIGQIGTGERKCNYFVSRGGTNSTDSFARYTTFVMFEYSGRLWIKYCRDFVGTKRQVLVWLN